MRNILTTCLLFLSLLSFSQEKDSTLISNFELKTVGDTTISLEKYPGAKGFIIIFTSNQCPFAKLYPERMNALHQKYASQNIPVIAIRSTDPDLMPEDTFEKMKKAAKRNNFSFPYAADDDQKVAKMFHAEKTPHAFVIWNINGKWVIKYSGAIDDNGAEPGKVTHAYIQEAIDDLQNNREVRTPVTKSVGCQIKYR